MSRMGSEICRLRKEAGMTQKQLARQVGVTERFVDEIETGKKVLNSELIARVSKALRKEVGSLDLYDEEEVRLRPEPEKNIKKVVEKPVQAVWTDALAGVIMAVPVYDGKMINTVGSRQLPIIANKIEGFQKDKVFYLTVDNNEMSGFRLLKGDMVLASSIQEIDRDALYFIEINGIRRIRQIKKLDQDKLLLVSNSGSIMTEAVSKKNVKVIARLVRLEIML